jgi:hypothetical protein
MTKWRMGVLASLMAMSVAWTSPARAQVNDRAMPFQIMEATTDDIHAAFKSGKLTARGTEHQFGHYDQPERAGRSRQARFSLQEVGPNRAAAWHSGAGPYCASIRPNGPDFAG